MLKLKDVYWKDPIKAKCLKNNISKLKDVNWGDPLKAVCLKNDFFDEMYGAEMLELTWGDINDLVKGGTLYVVIEGEYALLIRLKGV